jgi:DUF1680 family protein
MNELSASQVVIDDKFWGPRLLTNARVAIFHQWQQLESSRCIDNFRLVTGEKVGFREGWFFSDSDAYKWLDAAARIYANWPDEKLNALMDGLIAMIGVAQSEDGYIFTYNQLHFPGEHWSNLMIEHELYCHGHLIEAAVSHFEATGASTALAIALKAADLLVKDFLDAGNEKTSGHEEIEIALLRLYHLNGNTPYLTLAGQFLERRGKTQPFFRLISQQNSRVTRRGKIVHARRQEYLKAHPNEVAFQLPPDNYAKKPSNSRLRWMLSALSGKYFQMHSPIRKQTVPVGHSVRFGYLETAIAMLVRINGDKSLLPAMEKAWEKMVTSRMYLTGGVGSVPGLEGFGRDDELDPEIAYAETCASLASMFWNWEMTLLTGYAQFADLFEWQLYNAAAVGMGLDGCGYLYNNPLECHGGITRRPWFLVPCCPSNLSRTWASLGKYIYSFEDKEFWIHQYIGSQAVFDSGNLKVRMESSLPWKGQVRFVLDLPSSSEYTFHFRIPSWAGNLAFHLNGHPIEVQNIEPKIIEPQAASGFDPRRAWYLSLRRLWSPSDRLELEFELPVQLRQAGRHVKCLQGKIAITRGPLVYCLENIDNPGMDIFEVCIDPESIQARHVPHLLGNIWTLQGRTKDGRDFTAIPYHLWANRGESQMAVWLRT